MTPREVVVAAVGPGSSVMVDNGLVGCLVGWLVGGKFVFRILPRLRCSTSSLRFWTLEDSDDGDEELRRSAELARQCGVECSATWQLNLRLILIMNLM
jgi:hypothetical protein